jgi:hypothetical protein
MGAEELSLQNMDLSLHYLHTQLSLSKDLKNYHTVTLGVDLIEPQDKMRQ